VVIPVQDVKESWTELSQTLLSANRFGVRVLLIHDSDNLLDQIYVREFLAANFIDNVKNYTGNFGGPGAARNFGMGMVQTEWITFWDSDDIPNVELIDSLLRTINLENKSCIVGGYRIQNVQGVRSEIYEQKNLFEVAINPGLWRWIIRTSTLGRARFADSRMGEDQCFLAGYVNRNITPLFTSDSFYTYVRGRPNQLTLNPSAISDLSKSLLETLLAICAKDAVSLRFGSILLVRQLFTLVTKQDLRRISIPVGFLKNLILKGNLILFFEIVFRAPFFILKNRSNRNAI
jgi:hypothetical protein